MSKNWLTKVIPPPEYLTMPAVGLDVSDQSVKWIRLNHTNRGPRAQAWGEKEIPLGTIQTGKVHDPAELAEVLRSLRPELKMTHVNASLPEEQTYLFRLKLPKMRLNELAEAVLLQLDEHIPLAPDQAVFDFEIISSPTKSNPNFELAVSAMPRQMLEEYIAAMSDAGLVVKSCEIEGHSLGRALLKSGDPGTVLVVDIGKVRTGFSIISAGALLYTATIDKIGGQDITASIQKSLGLSAVEAERVKIEKGVANMTGDRELFFALVPVLSTLKDEISRVYSYWHDHQGDNGFARPPIEAVILSGGQATLPGLIDYMRGNLDVPVSLGSPWVNVVADDDLPPIEFNQAIRYSTAIGLALRDII